MPEAPVLEVEGLSKSFVTKRSMLGRPTDHIHAVKDVSLTVHAGRTTALVGESGSGKSSTARLIARLDEPDEGTVRVCGADWTAMGKRELRESRKDLQMIFQDPYGSLDPMKMIVHAVGEPLLLRERMSRSDLDAMVSKLLEEVGMDPAHLHRYPYEFSGGQRQRLCIARALCARPRIIVADEAVSALDVSVQAQVLNLVRQIQRDDGVAFLFISHDLGVVRQVADDIAVMYLGRIVESGPADDVFNSPSHPYTQSLLEAVPDVNPWREAGEAITVSAPDVPDATPASADSGSAVQLSGPAGETGCEFRARCPIAIDRCATETPLLRQIGSQRVACHRADETLDPTTKEHI